jgi:hypothetical protein
MEGVMELRHLRYFIVVAEEGSLTLAAKKRLHTAQPSLSRQNPRASAMQLPLPADQALHLCKSPLAGDPIIGAIRFTSTSEGRHGRLHRQPDVNKRFLGRCD